MGVEFPRVNEGFNHSISPSDSTTRNQIRVAVTMEVVVRGHRVCVNIC